MGLVSEQLILELADSPVKGLGGVNPGTRVPNIAPIA